MLDRVAVFSKSGAILWSQDYAPVKGDPVNAVIHTILLEDRTGKDLYQDANYSVKWCIDNEMDIVVVAVYQRVIVLPYVDDLLSQCKDAFVSMLGGIAEGERENLYPCKAFTKKFDSLQAELEQRAMEERKSKLVKAPRSFSESKKFANTKQGNKQSCMVGGGKDSEPGGGKGGGGGAAAAAGGEADGEADGGDANAGLTQDQIAANIAKMRAGGRPGSMKKKPSGIGGGGGGGGDEGGADGATPPMKKGKEMRSWDGSKKEEGGKKEQLDFSKKLEKGESRVRVFKGGAVDLNQSFGNLGDDDDDDDDDDAYEAAVANSKLQKGKSGGLFSSLKSLVGAKSLERSDVEPLMETLKEKLVEKNVASDIGGQICESVCTSLLGKQLGSFGSLRTTVRDALEKTLTRILTPSRRVDLLAGVAAAKAEKRPYTIVFVGVNGVGKSTSLSKVAYYLKTNGFTPMLCACDTFRAGAVEQLRVHAQSLELPLYEKGYGKDAAGIATDGIRYAGQMGYDVVMVDTAGRMQDNEPLMRSLSKLVTLNDPDLVLFVGEALVGNEAVDQVSGFNTALSEYSASREPRLIDGIMLTKFDTIDDKVGAALSLVYTTGKPIVFVGVGQTYTDIRNLNVDHCVRALIGR